MPSLSVSIQPEDFDIGQEHLRLRAQDERVGAVCSFLGTVRSQNEGLSVAAMSMIHVDYLQAFVIHVITRSKKLYQSFALPWTCLSSMILVKSMLRFV